MNPTSAHRRISHSTPRHRRFMTAALLTVIAGFFSGSLGAQTSVVPGLISYQGRVTAANGTLVGDTTPVNRKITFRIWNHASDALPANLIYAESQTATIAAGEFSVMIGQGTALATETGKGPPTLKISDISVFGGATAAIRYLGVTVDDGSGTYNVEISPRQQIVTSAYAFRARYAEQIGANGATTITALDNGRVGIGTSSPSSTLDVVGGIKASGAGGYTFNSGDADGGIFSPADNTMTFFTNNAERVRLVGDNLGIGTTTPVTRLDVNGNISATAAGGYVFGAGDTDTGMFSPGDNHVIFKTGGTERMRIDNLGRIGMGTTGPSLSLEVRSATPEMVVGTTGGTLGALYLGNNGHGMKRNFANVANDLGVYTTAGSVHLSAGGASTGQFVLTPSGDVGIGTSAPGARLQVSSGTNHMQVLPGILNGTATANAITFDVPNTFSGMFSFWDNLVVSGNLGVGNTAPTAKLDVSGGVKVTGAGGYGFSSGDNDGGIFSPADGTITFRTDNTEKMRLDPSGNLGIGTAGPMSAKLDVNGNIAAAAGFVFGHGDVDTGMYPIGPDGNTIVFQTANVERVRFTSGGRVGIGNNAPIAPLHVSNSANTTFTLRAYMDANNVTAAPDTANTVLSHSIVSDSRVRADAFDVSSDARIKNIIGRSAGASDLATLQKIQVTDYTMKDTVEGGTKTHKKVIAQQVEEVFPTAVGKSTSVIPDIFQKGTIAEGWVQLTTTLQVGDRVRLIAANKDSVHEVLEVAADRFRTAFKAEADTVFVYGREVKDFRSVDYDAISMLNVSATQEIKREKDAEVKALRDDNAALRARLAALEAKDQARDVKLAAIEQLLRSAAGVVARPAAPVGANGQD